MRTLYCYVVLKRLIQLYIIIKKKKKLIPKRVVLYEDGSVFFSFSKSYTADPHITYSLLPTRDPQL